MLFFSKLMLSFPLSCLTPLLIPFHSLLSHPTHLSFPLYLVTPHSSLLFNLSCLIPLLSPFHSILYYPKPLSFPLCLVSSHSFLLSTQTCITLVLSLSTLYVNSNPTSLSSPLSSPASMYDYGFRNPRYFYHFSVVMSAKEMKLNLIIYE